MSDITPGAIAVSIVFTLIAVALAVGVIVIGSAILGAPA